MGGLCFYRKTSEGCSSVDISIQTDALVSPYGRSWYRLLSRWQNLHKDLG